MHILLASASPRRRVLLERVGYRVTVQPVDCEEHFSDGADGVEAALAIAARKANAFLAQLDALNVPTSARIALTADTVVWLEGEAPIGKPVDHADARAILRRLAGRWHNVSTAFCLVEPATRDLLHSECVTSRVRFHELSDEDIERYLLSPEPWDKAGSYGLQGEGALLVDRIEGSWDNIVGLPVARVARALRRLQVQPGLFPASREIHP